MRILLSLESYLPHISGVVIFTERIAAYMVSKGHDVRILTTSSTTPYSEKDPRGFFIMRLRGWRNPFRRDLKISFWWNKRDIERLFEDFKPDIVHLQDQGVLNRLVLRASRARRIPVIAHHHFSMEFVLAYFRAVPLIHPLVRALIRASSRNFYNRATLVLTPTEFSRRALLGWGIKTQVLAISNGAELSRFNPPDTRTEKKALEETARRYGIPRDQPVILYIGRMDQDKNIQTLSRAIPLVLAKTSAFFLFVGEGNDRKDIESWVSRYPWKDQVKFLGFVPHEDPELPRLYQLSTIYWTASTIETQSITTLEAMAVGLPIIAANAGALPELVHEGENGFLVGPYDPQGFSRAVMELIQSPELAKRFGKKSIEIARHHSIAESLRSLEQIYGHYTAKHKRSI